VDRVRMLLCDDEERQYKYILSVSKDGSSWNIIRDANGVRAARRIGRGRSGGWGRRVGSEGGVGGWVLYDCDLVQGRGTCIVVLSAADQNLIAE
jgi:hypothetical protein